MTCSVMWIDSTKSAIKKLKVAYNNSLHRLFSLPTCNNPSEMFAFLIIPFIFISRIAKNISCQECLPQLSYLW